MSAPTDNESWVIDLGSDIVEKKARLGVLGLTDWEHLVYCLWVADYMMRNGGDFANAITLYPRFQDEGRERAQKLRLTLTAEMFSLSQRQLEVEYLRRFEAVCSEIRNAERAG